MVFVCTYDPLNKRILLQLGQGHELVHGQRARIVQVKLLESEQGTWSTKSCFRQILYLKQCIIISRASSKDPYIRFKYIYGTGLADLQKMRSAKEMIRNI